MIERVLEWATRNDGGVQLVAPAALIAGVMVAHSWVTRPILDAGYPAIERTGDVVSFKINAAKRRDCQAEGGVVYVIDGQGPASVTVVDDRGNTWGDPLIGHGFDGQVGGVWSFTLPPSYSGGDPWTHAQPRLTYTCGLFDQQEVMPPFPIPPADTVRRAAQ